MRLKTSTISEIRFLAAHALMCKMAIKVFGVYSNQKARQYAYTTQKQFNVMSLLKHRQLWAMHLACCSWAYLLTRMMQLCSCTFDKNEWSSNNLLTQGLNKIFSVEAMTMFQHKAALTQKLGLFWPGYDVFSDAIKTEYWFRQLWQ